MADFPALPLWTDAYMADCGHLTDAEHGRYLRLIMAMWRSPECRIPNDDKWLARKFGRSVEDVQSQLRPLIDEFCQTDGNWIFQKRLLKERNRVVASGQKQRDRAKSRWNKDKVECPGNASVALHPDPDPDPILREKETTKVAKKKSRASPLNGHQSEFDLCWKEYPLKKGKGAAEVAYLKAIALTDFSTIMAAIKIYALSRRGEDPQFTSHFATWLNKKRWLDEPDEPIKKLSGGLFGGAMI